MDDLEKGFRNIRLRSFDSYEELKEHVISFAKDDYLFFPFLIGFVKRYLPEKSEENLIKFTTLELIMDLLVEKSVDVYFVDSENMILAESDTKDQIKLVLTRIRSEWDMLKDRAPEVNEIVWLHRHKK